MATSSLLLHWLQGGKKESEEGGHFLITTTLKGVRRVATSSSPLDLLKDNERKRKHDLFPKASHFLITTTLTEGERKRQREREKQLERERERE